jgi:hypothetical protein
MTAWDWRAHWAETFAKDKASIAGAGGVVGPVRAAWLKEVEHLISVAQQCWDADDNEGWCRGINRLRERGFVYDPGQIVLMSKADNSLYSVERVVRVVEQWDPVANRGVVEDLDWYEVNIDQIQEARE